MSWPGERLESSLQPDASQGKKLGRAHIRKLPPPDQILELCCVYPGCVSAFSPLLSEWEHLSWAALSFLYCRLSALQSLPSSLPFSVTLSGRLRSWGTEGSRPGAGLFVLPPCLCLSCSPMPAEESDGGRQLIVPAGVSFGQAIHNYK